MDEPQSQDSPHGKDADWEAKQCEPYQCEL